MRDEPRVVVAIERLADVERRFVEIA